MTTTPLSDQKSHQPLDFLPIRPNMCEPFSLGNSVSSRAKYPPSSPTTTLEAPRSLSLSILCVLAFDGEGRYLPNPHRGKLE